MKKPQIEDFKLKSIKIPNGGGAVIKWEFLASVGNEAHMFRPSLETSLNVHDELWTILRKQKPNVLKVEEVDYRLMSTTAKEAGADNEELLAQIAEGMTQEAMSKIEITGMKISGMDDKTNVVVTYKKITGNKKIAGRATTAIQLSGNVYGFEEDLEDDLEELKVQVYDYIYNGKHSDSAQGELWKQVEDELDEDEDSESQEE